ncbi:reverse transcriptase domain-containing protein [Tanacetum coccineum]
MAQRTMEELSRAKPHRKGSGEAIVLPEINADHFEIKTNLLQLVQANPFHGLENENPHAHINSFKRITSTLRFRNVPNDVIKLMMFPYSLEGATKIYVREWNLPNSYLAWEDLVSTIGIKIFSPFRMYLATNPNLPVTPISIPEPDVPKTLPKTTPIPEPDVPKNLPNSNIPYPSRRNDQKSRDKASNQMEKIFQIIQDLRFDISFTDALLLMAKISLRLRVCSMNKEKLLELAKIPLNENCSAMLLKKLPKNIGDLSKLSLPELTPTRMTLELADRSITHPKGLAEDIYVKVGKFHFPTDFVVVDFEADPQVPLILGRSFLRTGRALIDFKKFTDEPTLVCLPPSEDDDDEKEKQEVKILAEPIAKRQTRITPCLKNFKVICKESIFHSNKTHQVSSVFAITSTLPSIEPKDSLIMGDEHPILFHQRSLDDFMTFSNPLFEFDVNFNSSDINPLFDEVLEDIECKDSYDSNLDESTFLVTPLSDSNKDECLAPGDDIEILLHHDPSTPMKSVASILEGFIDIHLLKKIDDLFDLDE